VDQSLGEPHKENIEHLDEELFVLEESCGVLESQLFVTMKEGRESEWCENIIERNWKEMLPLSEKGHEQGWEHFHNFDRDHNRNKTSTCSEQCHCLTTSYKHRNEYQHDASLRE
jgi:hypothetical protein